MQIASYGAGTNSTAMIIECLNRGEQIDHILFADTGGERPETYTTNEELSMSEANMLERQVRACRHWKEGECAFCQRDRLLDENQQLKDALMVRDREIKKLKSFLPSIYWD